MNLDDIESLLEELLAGLKARKEIEPLRQKISELEKSNETLTLKRDELIKKNSSLQAELVKFDERCDAFRRQLNEQQAKFDWEFSEVCTELSDARKTQRSLRAERDELIKKNSSLQAELDKLSAEHKLIIQQLNVARETFQRELREHKAEFDRDFAEVCNELSEANDIRRKAEHEADFYRKTYGELDAAYKIYSSLDESTRFDLAGIFGKGDTVSGFFGGAVQESHLPQFWDYVSRHVDDLRLAELFDFCFTAINRAFREPPYIRLKIEHGNYFDDETMRRTSRSRQNGNVARVLLQGYRYSSGKVVRQSIVELA